VLVGGWTFRSVVDEEYSDFGWRWVVVVVVGGGGAGGSDWFGGCTYGIGVRGYAGIEVRVVGWC